MEKSKRDERARSVSVCVLLPALATHSMHSTLVIENLYLSSRGSERFRN